MVSPFLVVAAEASKPVHCLSRKGVPPGDDKLRKSDNCKYAKQEIFHDSGKRLSTHSGCVNGKQKSPEASVRVFGVIVIEIHEIGGPFIGGIGGFGCWGIIL